MIFPQPPYAFLYFPMISPRPTCFPMIFLWLLGVPAAKQVGQVGRSVLAVSEAQTFVYPFDVLPGS